MACLHLMLWPQKPVLPAIAGVIAGSFSFYKQLEKSRSTKPSWVFGPLCCPYLSLRSFTALTSVENSISMTVFFFRSSQIMTRTVQRLH